MRPPILFVFLLLTGSAFAQVAAVVPPNDANRLQLVVVGDSATGPSKWFEDLPELKAIKKRTAFSSFSVGAPLYKTRFEDKYGTNYPIVALQRPDGGVIYFADKDTMPAKENLYEELKQAVIFANSATKAKNGIESIQQIEQEVEGFIMDCVDGVCTPRDEEPPKRFPNLHPFSNTKAPVAGGLFGGAISSGIWLVFAVVALGCVFFFFVLILAAMYMVVKLIGRVP